MTKRIIAALLSLVCAATMLSACGGNDSSNASSASQSDSSASTLNVDIPVSLTIDGKEIDTKDLVMCSFNGVDVDFETFRYYWLGFKSNFESAGVEITADQLKQYVMFQIKEDLGIVALGKENNIEYTATEEQAMIDSYNQLLMGFTTEDSYVEWLNKMFYTDYAVQQFLYNNTYADKVYNELFGEKGKLTASKEDFLAATKTDDYIRVVHILVPYSTCAPLSEEDKEGWDELDKTKQFEKLESAYAKLSEDEKAKVKEESKKIAEEVLQKAKDGEDFFKLISEYNSDPGMALTNKDDITSIPGYYFTKDYSFVQEFLDGSFALKVDEISGIVESKSYGYHIIKRLPIDEKYVEENVDTLLKEYNNVIFNKTYDDFIVNKLKVEYSEYFDKLTIDSIK